MSTYSIPVSISVKQVVILEISSIWAEYSAVLEIQRADTRPAPTKEKKIYLGLTLLSN